MFFLSQAIPKHKKNIRIAFATTLKNGKASTR
jgi:hypothetical protein